MKPRLILIAAWLLTGRALIANDFAAAEAVASAHGRSALEAAVAEIAIADLRSYVQQLASDEYEGRGTGDRGERMATAYVASFFEGLGLAPEGEDGGYFQNFEFRAGMELRGDNFLTLQVAEPVGLVRKFEPGQHYQPLAISSAGELDPTGVVFAGFGIEAEGYNSFEGLEVEGRWVMVLRGAPRERKELERFGPLVAKANAAKKQGAAGIIFIKGTNPAIATELVPPTSSVGGRGGILPAITVTDRLAASLLTGGDDLGGLGALFEQYNGGQRVAGFALPWRLGGEIGIAENRDPGRNVVARLVVGESRSEEVIVIGAHVDHLGYGNRGGSRAKGEDASAIHRGADDNASGVAALMELAHYFAEQKATGTSNGKRDLVFAAWSGEELGLHGSRHYVEQLKERKGESLHPAVAAYLNLDMVGRAGENGLTVHGTGSSAEWKEILGTLAPVPGLEVKQSDSPYIPTDTAPFYGAGVPVLAAFTGLHDDYHTPADTVDKVDFEGLEKVSTYMRALVTELNMRGEVPGYVKVERGQGRPTPPGVRLGVALEPGEGGVRLAQVMDESPAARAGLKPGDVVVRLADAEVATAEDFLAQVRKMKPGQEYSAVVMRGEERMELRFTPEAR